MIDPALTVLSDSMQPVSEPTIRLSAAKDVLDRNKIGKDDTPSDHSSTVNVFVIRALDGSEWAPKLQSAPVDVKSLPAADDDSEHS